MFHVFLQENAIFFFKNKKKEFKYERFQTDFTKQTNFIQIVVTHTYIHLARTQMHTHNLFFFLANVYTYSDIVVYTVKTIEISNQQLQ